jgi:hypothetical protein
MSSCGDRVVIRLAALVACACGCGHEPAGAGAVTAPAATVDPPPLCPAFAADAPANVCTAAPVSGFSAKTIDKTYACGELLQGTGKLLELWRDPFTGLPYAAVPFGGPRADQTGGAEPAAGVFPQFPLAACSALAEDPAQAAATVTWRFVDRAPDGTLPTLLWALQISLDPEEGRPSGPRNRWGGLAWHTRADVSRYDKIRIRYRTAETDSRWQVKLDSGTGRTREPAVALPGTQAWADVTLDIARDFAGTDAAHLDRLIFSAPRGTGGRKPTLWIDQVTFLAAPSRLADCAIACPSPAPAYPDLACLEPQTSVADIAAALSFFATAPAAGQIDEARAQASATRILESLASLPGTSPGVRADGETYPGGGWFQDWHSPASLMPDPTHRRASLAAQAQLYAALMVVETTWPTLAARAAVLRRKLDFTVVFDTRHGCPGRLRAGIDRCDGLRDPGAAEDATDGLAAYGVLAAFLATATNAASPIFWTTALSARGCDPRGAEAAPFYPAGAPCPTAAIPASDGGGPAVPLASLIFLDGERIPMGRLPLATSAANMVRAQYAFAREHNLALAGWSAAAYPLTGDGRSCADFAPERPSPYVSAMAASDEFPEAYRMVRAFHLLGADACVITGAEIMAFGLRDAFDQASARAEDRYRYLHTGWTQLGLLNACRHDLVRQRFGQHQVAQNGYALVQSAAPPCP